jgi:phage shock protein PspC (stress-responsive transcriptional regulator)
MRKEIQELQDLFSAQLPANRGTETQYEIQALVKDYHELGAEESRNISRSRLVFGAGFLLFGGITGLLAASSFLPMLDSQVLFVLGLMGLVGFGAYTAQRMKANPLQYMKNKIDEAMAKMMRKQQKLRAKSNAVSPVLPFKRRDRMVAGVASFLAERVGISTGAVRAVLVLMMFMSFGFVVPAYFIAAVVIGYLEEQKQIQ